MYPWPKHKSLSLSQVMEHHFTYLQWDSLGTLVVGSACWFFFFHLKKKKKEEKNKKKEKRKKSNE